ncbi:hypothetical protein DXF93_13695 [Escherichia coli]|nr:hypothetical protein DXF93_13695 [Escherichia coli]
MEKTNPDKICYIWHDADCSFCANFHQSIDYYLKKNTIDIESQKIQIKNEAFDFIFPKLALEFNFNELAKEFLNKKNIPMQGVMYEKIFMTHDS